LSRGVRILVRNEYAGCFIYFTKTQKHAEPRSYIKDAGMLSRRSQKSRHQNARSFLPASEKMVIFCYACGGNSQGRTEIDVEAREQQREIVLRQKVTTSTSWTR
jgi:hypothetical protein